ncbi:hypothetical protein [Halodesulfovibrio marinisediminis]|uniref:Uncharacterized protein n=1 Tax=Halodesulfovibrio marinisediminis DSM 17456 TaxID=1121457 RepID=A0A1N6DDJ1_9BACT|nr:hypothetical protein [Halodesulfovibrio marinisediminis]SIN68851.1 hypothetical protein SAMN02745161_0038 [Halodesulfovibrio marinisediminis DSM 17456]
MTFTYKDLPVVLRETELLTLKDGTQLRFESNGGAQEVFVNDEWTSRASLFQGMDHLLTVSDEQIHIISEADGLRVELK